MDASVDYRPRRTRLRHGEEPAALIVFLVRRRAESAPGLALADRARRGVSGGGTWLTSATSGESRRRIGVEQLAAANYLRNTAGSPPSKAPVERASLVQRFGQVPDVRSADAQVSWV